MSVTGTGQKFTFHILGVPHTATSIDYVACAYTQKIAKFVKMMGERGHTIKHYGNELSEIQFGENIPVTTAKDLEIAYGHHDWRKKGFIFSMDDHAYRTFYENAKREIAKHSKPGEFLLAFWGAGHRPVCDQFPDLIVVEPGIGYAEGQFARWKVYESYSLRSAVNGIDNVKFAQEDWYQAVIPNYFDPNDFDFSAEKDDYFLFLGRITRAKGLDLAIQVCQKIKKKIIVAGQGSLEEAGIDSSYEGIEFVGHADIDTRRKLMSRAKGFFLPSMFNEPFGGAAVEALFSGTPIITTDWGVFPETNLHGKTGYRCRTFEQFCWAAENIESISSHDCAKWANENYSLSKASEMYEEYFTMVWNVYNTEGWYQQFPERENLNWLKKANL
jgi:glycosyltransferase involved in cell wall biosynthesis